MKEERPPDTTPEDLRNRAEDAVRKFAALLPENLSSLSPEHARRLLHELRVHQAELETQNGEFLRSYAELEASRAQYLDLYDRAPIGYLTVGSDGLILEANLTASTLLGVPRSSLVRQPLTRFILMADQDIYCLHRKQMLETGSPRSCELRLLRQDGAVFWATLLESTTAQDGTGAELCRVVISDITERKQAEETQQAAAARVLLQREVISRLAISRWVNEGHVVKAAGEMTEAVATAFCIGRVSVWLFNEKGTELVCVDLYDATSRQHSVGAVLFEHEFKTQFKALKSDRYEAIDDTLVDPRAAAYVESYLKPLRITSTLNGIILSGDRNLGVLCFEHRDQPHHWEQDEISFNSRLADQLGKAVLNRERRKAEEALVESETRYRGLFEAESDAIVLIDNETGFILEANSAASDLYGFSRNELLTKMNTDLSAEPEETRKITGMSAVNAGQIVSIPLRFHRKKDGTVFPVEINARSVMLQNRSVHIAAIRDITERRRAEESQRESEHKFRAIFERSPIGIVLTDDHGVIVDCNLHFAGMFGAAREQYLGRNMLKSLPDGPVQRSLANAIAGKGRQEYEGPYVSIVSGRQLQISITVERITPGLLIAVVVDITERKNAELALRESENRFRTLLKQVPAIAVQGYGPDGTTQYWNQASERIYGYTEEEALGKNLLDLIIPPEMRPDVRRAIRQMAETGQPIPSSELSLMRKDGSRVAVYSSHAVVKPNGGDRELFCLDVDLTELKKAEERVHRSLREKEVLLKEIHHRVKNNMQVIYSLLNLQVKGIADPVTRAMFEDARNRVSSMALIHQKLYQSRDLAHVNFNEYLQSLVAGIADSYKKHNVVYSVDKEPVPLDVNVGIPCGLIVNELVSNCLKYAFPEGRTGMIKVGIRKDRSGNNVLTVSDNGIGFPDTVDFRNTTSLGLKLVNVLTGQIQGTIELLKAAGTTFRIIFPETVESIGERRVNSVIPPEDAHE